MTPSRYVSINIALIQARETILTYFRPALHELGITEQQWRIIRLLAENGTLDFQDLANQACILRPSLTGILTRLDNAGLVMRLKPSKDQRRVFIKLTEEGEAVFERARIKIDECYYQIEQKFTREKMDALYLLLKDLAAIRPDEMESHEFESDENESA